MVRLHVGGLVDVQADRRAGDAVVEDHGVLGAGQADAHLDAVGHGAVDDDAVRAAVDHDAEAVGSLMQFSMRALLDLARA